MAILILETPVYQDIGCINVMCVPCDVCTVCTRHWPSIHQRRGRQGTRTLAYLSLRRVQLFKETTDDVTPLSLESDIDHDASTDVDSGFKLSGVSWSRWGSTSTNPRGFAGYKEAVPMNG